MRRKEAQLRPVRVNAMQETEERDVGYAEFGYLADALVLTGAQRRAFGVQDVGEPIHPLDVQKVCGERETRRHKAVIYRELAVRTSCEPRDGAHGVVRMRLEIEQQSDRVALRCNFRVAGAVQVRHRNELA